MTSLAEFDGLSPARPAAVAKDRQPWSGEADAHPAGAVDAPAVYGRIARALLPRWTDLLRLSMPFGLHFGRAPVHRHDACGSCRRQFAALAAGVTCEMEGAWDSNEYLQECIRASLIEWQLSLRSNGAPRLGAAHRDPAPGATAGAVITLLDHTSRFQTPSLLGDLHRHLTRLAQRRCREASREASTICALADGATLVRDGKLLAIARERLAILLNHQTVEGWFDDGSSYCPGKTGGIIDSIVRVYAEHDWGELVEPIRRAVRFLTLYTTPDGKFVGYRDADGDAFLSPYGVEIMAPRLSEAAVLASAARAQCADLLSGGIGMWHDDLCIGAGARIAMAAMAAHRTPGDVPRERSYLPGPGVLHGAGIAVFDTRAYHAVVDTRHGGALAVTWHNDEPPLIDGGVAVEFLHATRSSGAGTSSAVRLSGDSRLIIEGNLRTTAGRPDALWRRLARWAKTGHGASARDEREGRPSVAVNRTDRGGGVCEHLAHDRFRREITFEPDAVRVCDTIDCRLPCQTVMCQTPALDERSSLQIYPENRQRSRPPISVEGGRKVELTRVYRNGRLTDAE